jgi:hypothetical protein
MTARPIPTRHWRSYGTDPLPTGTEALDEPFRAFPSWFMRVTCDRCGQQRMFSETHAAGQRDMLIRDIIARMRHDGCGGRAGKVCAPITNILVAFVKRSTTKLITSTINASKLIAFCIQRSDMG